MSFKKLVIPVLVLVIFVGGGFAAYNIADAGQKSAARGDGTLVENESITQEVGTWQLVDRSTNEFTAGFNGTVTVRNNSSTVLTEGEDYEWNGTDGAVLFLDSPSTNDGEPANISYTVYTNTGGVQDLSGPLRVITEAIGQFAYLAGGLGLVVLLLGVAYIVARVFGDSGPKTNR